MKMKFTVPLKDVLDELAPNLCLLCPADCEKGVPPVEGVELLAAGLDDLQAEVMCEYTEGQPDTWWEQGWDPMLELHSVACTSALLMQPEGGGYHLTVDAGTDLLPLLSNAGVDHLTERLFPLAEQELAEAHEQALIERAEARAEARKEELALA